MVTAMVMLYYRFPLKGILQYPTSTYYLLPYYNNQSHLLGLGLYCRVGDCAHGSFAISGQRLNISLWLQQLLLNVDISLRCKKYGIYQSQIFSMATASMTGHSGSSLLEEVQLPFTMRKGGYNEATSLKVTWSTLPWSCFGHTPSHQGHWPTLDLTEDLMD